MNLKEFKKILKNGTDEAKHKAMSNADLSLLNIEIFDILFELLKDSNPNNRFFAIFHLIDKFPKSLSKIKDDYITEIYNTLFDEYTPVADRATWALSIAGEKALEKLVKEYHSGSIDTKIKIVYAIGRGKFSEHSKKRIQILLDGIKSDNDNLKFQAMSAIMSNTNLESKNIWNSVDNPSIDLKKIHKMILPIAKEFNKSSNKHFKDSSVIYINWIEKTYNKV
ncbi:HEAT repeat domain-containing protein [uncultured Aquimarina sp.]|uniref:HEAT repeat domain-containing protein n=1 Tax=uncultured Aquimarina sp. TaxID=575652 RepID=UPI002606BEC7|nr:HEAT repeat domain-containing protein [uncultured Aquimarina sp.]